MTETVGHFYLFGWLQEVLRRQCVVSPEFPTGNGKAEHASVQARKYASVRMFDQMQ